MAEDNSSDYDVKELLEAAKFIFKKAQDVHIDQEGIKRMASHVIRYLKENKTEDCLYMLTNRCRRDETFPNRNDSKAIDWLFVLHTLNFALWNRKGSEQWTVKCTNGYFGLCNAIKRAIVEGKEIWDPKYYTRMTQSDLEYILRGDDDKISIPLIQERVAILREVGQVLLDKYDGTFEKCVEAAGYNADKLIKLLFNEFEAYRDEAVFEGSKVRFHSKTMSLIIDIWHYYKQLNDPKFHLDTQKMISTMFIDYRTTQIFIHFKALRYSNMLVSRFENSDEPLKHGSREELEIRGCSLLAASNSVKKYKERANVTWKEIPLLKSKAFNVSILIDNYLLGVLVHSHEGLMKHEPFHYIRTVYY